MLSSAVSFGDNISDCKPWAENYITLVQISYKSHLHKVLNNMYNKKNQPDHSAKVFFATKH